MQDDKDTQNQGIKTANDTSQMKRYVSGISQFDEAVDNDMRKILTTPEITKVKTSFSMGKGILRNTARGITKKQEFSVFSPMNENQRKSVFKQKMASHHHVSTTKQESGRKRINSYSQPPKLLIPTSEMQSHSVHSKALADFKGLNLFFVKDGKETDRRKDELTRIKLKREKSSSYQTKVQFINVQPNILDGSMVHFSLQDECSASDKVRDITTKFQKNPPEGDQDEIEKPKKILQKTSSCGCLLI